MLVEFTRNDGTPLSINPAFVVGVGQERDHYNDEYLDNDDADKEAPLATVIYVNVVEPFFVKESLEEVRDRLKNVV